MMAVAPNDEHHMFLFFLLQVFLILRRESGLNKHQHIPSQAIVSLKVTQMIFISY